MWCSEALLTSEKGDLCDRVTEVNIAFEVVFVQYVFENELEIRKDHINMLL